MRILFDECVPGPLAKLLAEHECLTAQQMGWAGIKNGQLLRLAERQFDVFMTSDRNIRYQQDLRHLNLAVVQLSTNKLRRIEAGLQLIRSALTEADAGKVLFVAL